MTSRGACPLSHLIGGVREFPDGRAALRRNPEVVLMWDGTEHVVATSAKQEAAAIKEGLAIGNTYRQIGPVSTYEATNGDLYVAHIIEVTGPGHPKGDPIIGFYRVHNDKVIQQIGIDASHP